MIQWIALSSEAAADDFAIKNFPDKSIQIRVVPIKGPSKRLFAVISGEYGSKREALEASNKIARVNTEKPYIKRTLILWQSLSYPHPAFDGFGASHRLKK